MKNERMMTPEEKQIADGRFTANGDVMEDAKYPCPCCDEKTLLDFGIFEICPNCKWEDDDVQRDNPDFANSANKMSLNEAREAYRQGKPIE